MASKLVVVSVEIKDWLVKQFEINECEVTIVGSFLPIPDEYKQALSEKDNKNFLQVTSIGALNYEYGFLHVLDAVKRLRGATELDIRVTLIACSFELDDVYWKRLLEYGLWVDVLIDVSRKVTLRKVLNSDIFIRSSRYESFGLSKVEALLLGVPVICTNVGQTVGMKTYEYGYTEGLQQLIHSAIINPSKFCVGVELAQDYYGQMASQNLSSTFNFLDLNCEQT